VPTFEELRSRATEAEILDSNVWVCSLVDLKSMKRAAGRTRDLADLEDLDAVAGRRLRLAAKRWSQCIPKANPPYRWDSA
jgi:hypothetical protein